MTQVAERPALATHSASAALWAEALKRLSGEDQAQFDGSVTQNKSHQEILKDVLEATNQKKAECLGKRWKSVIGGKTIIFRDLLEKMTVWVQKFIAVGDTIVQYDPAHAALPWAAVRFFLQLSINETEIFGAVLESIEPITNILSRSAIMEVLYLQRSLAVSARFEESLIFLYADILASLSKILRYLKRSTFSRIARSIVTDSSDIRSWSSPIAQRQLEVERLASLAEAEKSQQSKDHLQYLIGAQQQDEKASLERDNKLRQQIQELEQPINRIDKYLSELHDNISVETKSKLLNAVSRVPYARYHEAARSGRLSKSGEWLLRKPLYRNWLTNSSSSILWLHGIPGCGKTKIASMIIDELCGMTNLAYFYCSRDPQKPELSSYGEVLASLVRQLACTTSSSALLDPVRNRIEAYEQQCFDLDLPSWSPEESIATLIELTGFYQSFTFVLDGLDEVPQSDCDDLLDALSQIVRQSGCLVKVFISSRDNVCVDSRIEEAEDLRIFNDDNAVDIERFVREKLTSARLLRGRLPSDLRSRIESTLISGAQGMFRWVELQIQSMRSLKVAADIESRLGRLPKTLEGSYMEIYEEISSSGEYASKLATFCFQWLLVGQTQISIDEFAILASAGNDCLNETYSASDVTDACLNLVSVDNTRGFRFAHLSVREFLESMDQRGITCFRKAEANVALASAYLSYLTILNNIQETRGSDIWRGREPSDLVLAAAGYWLLHVSQGQPPQPLREQIRIFLFKDGITAPIFERWCKLLHHSKLAYSLAQAYDDDPVLNQASRPPYSPLTVVHFFLRAGLQDLVCINEVSQLDKDTWLAAAIRDGDLVQTTYLWDHGARGSQIASVRIPSEEPRLIVQLLDHNIGPIPGTCLSTALTQAVVDGEPDVASRLLAYGVPKQKGAIADCISNGYEDKARTLIENGFDVNGISLTRKRTPLHWAVDLGLQSLTETLLAKGALVNAVDKDGNTPLHLALASFQRGEDKGHRDIVDMLIEQGPDLSIRNISGETALITVLSIVGTYWGPDKTTSQEVFETLLRMMYAQRFHNEEIVEMLWSWWISGYREIATWVKSSQKPLTKQALHLFEERRVTGAGGDNADTQTHPSEETKEPLIKEVVQTVEKRSAQQVRRETVQIPPSEETVDQHSARVEQAVVRIFVQQPEAYSAVEISNFDSNSG